jgi:ankyrin repeat protein
LWAASNGHQAVVKLLLGIGKVEADVKYEWSQTPLFRAAEIGHESIVKLLLETSNEPNRSSLCAQGILVIFKISNL